MALTPIAEGSGRSVEDMDNRIEVRDFLASRRARLSSEQARLTSYGSCRVPGLRRAEVAQLAGVSIEYYTRLERGNLSGASEVLDSLVGALQLDESERAYLFDLAKAASAPSTPRRPRKATGQEVRPNWSDSADTSVSILRTEAGRNPYDKGLTDLVGSCPRAPRSSAPAGPRTTSGGRRSAAKLRRVRAARRAGPDSHRVQRGARHAVGGQLGPVG
jgi:transcriptional regulator with XRE-family HTH domain